MMDSKVQLPEVLDDDHLHRHLLKDLLISLLLLQTLLPHPMMMMLHGLTLLDVVFLSAKLKLVADSQNKKFGCECNFGLWVGLHESLPERESELTF